MLTDNQVREAANAYNEILAEARISEVDVEALFKKRGYPDSVIAMLAIITSSTIKTDDDRLMKAMVIISIASFIFGAECGKRDK